MRPIMKICVSFKPIFFFHVYMNVLGRLAKSISASLVKFLNCTVSYQFSGVVDGRTSIAAQFNFPG